MCTATVMFVLSQDRLNMDVDRDSLELMLSLLESDTSHNSALEECGLSDQELAKTKQKVSSLCQEVQLNAGGHLSLDNITVSKWNKTYLEFMLRNFPIIGNNHKKNCFQGASGLLNTKDWLSR